MQTYINEDTKKKIDLIIHGLETGKFDQTLHKAEFIDKLAGDQPPWSFVRSLLEDIEELEEKLKEVEEQRKQLEYNLAQERDNYQQDMKMVAKAIRYLMTPDPISNYYELGDIRSWLESNGAQSFR